MHVFVTNSSQNNVLVIIPFGLITNPMAFFPARVFLRPIEDQTHRAFTTSSAVRFPRVLVPIHIT